MEYELIRSKRKTVAIYITKEASVQVRAPLEMPMRDIERAVKTKQGWIDSHQSLISQQAEKRRTFFVDYGSSVLLMGDEYRVEAYEGKAAAFDGRRFCMPRGLNSEEVKHALIKVYKKLAAELLCDRAAMYAARMEVYPKAVKINSAKTRWGSCSGAGNINFSWRIMMAPAEVIDYVVVHELAHLKEHNHSVRFWAAVEAVLPDYRGRQVRLKQLQSRLAGENWD